MIPNRITESLSVSLHFYETPYQEHLNKFYLPESQKKFTVLPVKILDLSVKDINRFPVVIVCGGRAVGFFVLHLGEEISLFTDNPRAILLRAFCVNFQFQNKGLGKKAMRQLPEFVTQNFPGVDEIVLAVNRQNGIAKSLYQNAGFQYKGRIRYGFLGLQHVLQYSYSLV
jgi:RimJ/RimL family protein N-acetyltransferase